MPMSMRSYDCIDWTRSLCANKTSEGVTAERQACTYLSQTEVAQPADAHAYVKQEVGRFDVTMDDFPLVTFAKGSKEAGEVCA